MPGPPDQDAEGVLSSGYLSLRPGFGGGGGLALVVGANLPPFLGSYVPCFCSAMVIPLACPPPSTVSEEQLTGFKNCGKKSAVLLVEGDGKAGWSA